MNAEETKREKLIKFIKSTNPFYLFTSFDGYSIKQLEEIKMNIQEAIKATSQKNKQKKKGNNK